MPIKRLAAQSASTTTMVSSVPMAKTLAIRLTRVEGCTRHIHRSWAGCDINDDKRPFISCRYSGAGRVAHQVLQGETSLVCTEQGFLCAADPMAVLSEQHSYAIEPT
jgi:hypothetical protein